MKVKLGRMNQRGKKRSIESLLCKETFSERRERFIVSNAAKRSVITNIYVEVVSY